MWIFTKYGFYSAVNAYTKAPTKTESPVMDDSVVCVRARVREHLETLCEEFQLDVKINEVGGTDYCCRILIAKEVWSTILASLSEEIDYTNFKEAVKAREPDDSPYCKALTEIWCVGFEMQRQLQVDEGEPWLPNYWTPDPMIPPWVMKKKKRKKKRKKPKRIDPRSF